jgi:large subunit ribosomal protein L29
MNKNKELLEKPDDQLLFMVTDLEREIFELRNELAVTRKLEKPHLLKEKKKLKAQILTKLSQRKKEKENGK